MRARAAAAAAAGAHLLLHAKAHAHAHPEQLVVSQAQAKAENDHQHRPEPAYALVHTFVRIRVALQPAYQLAQRKGAEHTKRHLGQRPEGVQQHFAHVCAQNRAHETIGAVFDVVQAERRVAALALRVVEALKRLDELRDLVTLTQQRHRVGEAELALPPALEQRAAPRVRCLEEDVAAREVDGPWVAQIVPGV